jgi:hypothetical protein
MLARTILTAAILTLLSNAAMAQCRVAAFRFTFGSDTSTTMTVKQGTVCVSNINPRAGSRFVGMRVTRKPRHGTAGNSGTTGVAYKPRPGFVGQDMFVATVSGSGTMGRVGRSNITFHVTVTP